MVETETETRSPADNVTYSLISALSERLEGIEAYRKYESDDPRR